MVRWISYRPEELVGPPVEWCEQYQYGKEFQSSQEHQDGQGPFAQLWHVGKIGDWTDHTQAGTDIAQAGGHCAYLTLAVLRRVCQIDLYYILIPS